MATNFLLIAVLRSSRILMSISSSKLQIKSLRTLLLKRLGHLILLVLHKVWIGTPLTNLILWKTLTRWNRLSKLSNLVVLVLILEVKIGRKLAKSKKRFKNMKDSLECKTYRNRHLSKNKKNNQKKKQQEKRL